MFNSKTKIEIKSVFGSVLFTHEAKDNTTVKTLLTAIKENADLSYADLSSANLSYADLSYANLRYANLSSANLSSANLSSANLSSANLSSANLRYADLSSANLSYANLRYANLSSANLSYADLRYANLRTMKLDKLPQDFINQSSRDILFILMHLKGEVPALRKMLIEGKVDGTQYEGECACLIGSLANADGGLENVCKAIPFYEKGLQNLGEQWFLQIRKGDTPETNDFSKHAVALCDLVVPPKKVASKKRI